MVNPEALIVFGGTDATQDPEFYLRNGADIVVKGEAENTFVLLLRAIDRHERYDDIPNIAYREGQRIIHTEKKFLIDYFDIESMPPPNLNIVDLTKYTDTGEGKPPHWIKGPFISIETSRGCAQACTFCATPPTKGRYRFMRIEQIKQHFEYFRSMGITTLLFQEDNVLSRIHRNGNGAYVYPEGREELLQMFQLARKMEFAWEFTNGLEFGQYLHQGRIDYELIETMFWHRPQNEGGVQGCYRATIPLESLTDSGVNLFRKLKPFGESEMIIRTLADTGINGLTFNLIIGRPQDDQLAITSSLQRCRSIQKIITETHSDVNMYFNVYCLSIFPGTMDYKRLNHMLAFDIERHPEIITFYLGCLQTPFFSPLELTCVRGTLASVLNEHRLIAEFDEIRFLTHSKFERMLSQL